MEEIKMLIFEEDKLKTLEFNMTELKNIKLEELSYKMCLVIEGIEYGIAASLDSESKKIVANIPPINEFVKVDLSNKDYLIRLEVTGADKKFYDSPWESKFKINATPKIEMSLKEDHDIDNQPEMKAELTEDSDVFVENTSFIKNAFKKQIPKRLNNAPINESSTIAIINDVKGLPNWFLKDQGV
jgi:hypothetical protein